jgi:urease accessory protein
MAEADLYELMSWLSPSWPVGAFAHSSGLEWAVEAGLVTDRASMTLWLEDWIAQGGGWTDAVLLVFAYRAVAANDRAALMDLVELALASQTSAERRLETTAQGGAFRRIARSAAPAPSLALLDGIIDTDLPYPIAVACLTSGRRAPLVSALTAYLHGAVSNLASAAQRLIPLGQTDGQLVIAALRETVAATTLRAVALDGDPFEAMGQACLMADFAAMAHETQYTRLFRT